MSIPPETRLVLLSAGPPSVDPELRRIAQRPLDWRAVAQVANREGADSVFARRLMEAGATFPDAVGHALRAIRRRAELRAHYMQQKLQSAVTTLTGNGVRVMLLKGAALATSSYGSFADRPMSDLDLLVESGDAPRAAALLLGSGWRARYAAAPDVLYRGMHHLPPLIDAEVPEMEVTIELHTELIPPQINPFRSGASNFWSAAVTHPGIHGALIPSPQHRLLHVLIHFSWSHMFSSGAWRAFRDVHALLAHGDVDVDEFARLAIAARARTCCYWPLALAQSLAGIEPPAELMSRLEPPQIGPWYRVVKRHLELEVARADVACPSDALTRWLWTAAIRPRASGHGSRRPWTGTRRPWHLLERGDIAKAARAPESRTRRAARGLGYIAGLLWRRDPSG